MCLRLLRSCRHNDNKQSSTVTFFNTARVFDAERVFVLFDAERVVSVSFRTERLIHWLISKKCLSVRFDIKNN